MHVNWDTSTPLHFQPRKCFRSWFAQMQSLPARRAQRSNAVIARIASTAETSQDKGLDETTLLNNAANNLRLRLKLQSQYEEHWGGRVWHLTTCQKHFEQFPHWYYTHTPGLCTDMFEILYFCGRKQRGTEFLISCREFGLMCSLQVTISNIRKKGSKNWRRRFDSAWWLCPWQLQSSECSSCYS